MKKYIIIASLLGLVSLPKTHAQINTNLQVQASINNQNPFIDASSQSAYPSVGKGIVFPRTNLATFKFKTDLFDGTGVFFPTGFDGMLVYNTHVEDNATIDDPATGSYTLDLKEGFYYFSNPNGDASGSLTGGRWKPLGNGGNLASFYTQDGTLSGDREVSLDNKKLSFTGGKIGINTTTPQATLDIEGKAVDITNPTQTPQGVSFPNFTSGERATFRNLKEGTMIYNTTKKCLEMYQGIVSGVPQWQCLPDAGSAQSQSVAVSPAGFEGQYIGGVALTTDNKVNFKLQNNRFTAISNVDFSNAVSIQNGTSNVQVAPNQNNDISLASGAETILSYQLTGTLEAGTLTATFDRLGLQADQSTQVGLGSATISNKDHYVVSMVYNSTTIQGKINNGAEKVTIEIPYTNGQGSYNAVNITQTSAPGQNNDTNPLTLKIQPNTFNAAGNLTATIEVGGDGEYLVKQLAPGVEYDIATFPVDMNGTQYNVVLKGAGGILDKKFGDGAHNFVYLPVEVDYGNGVTKTWLNMNLGAEAAKVGSSAFNPTLKKTGNAAHQDANLYGSLYQWQRPTDGHEFRNSPTTNTLADNWNASSPSGIVGKFIKTGSSNNFNWVSNGSNASGANLELWQSGKPNNPCPTGYHVPTLGEWEDFYEAVTGSRGSVSNNKMWNQALLPNFAAGGFRYNENGVLAVWSYYGEYWSSESNLGQRGKVLDFGSGRSMITDILRGSGLSIRCIKD